VTNHTVPARQRILDYLAAQGGSLESAQGQGLTRQLAEAVGYDDLSALNAMLTRLEREGSIARDVRGRRTYRIALVPGGRPGRAHRGRRTARDSEEAEEAHTAEELCHPRGQLRFCLLLLLQERPGHGYDLVERLKPFGYERDDPAQTYRALHWLESAGLVEPTWETFGSGPARRVYHVTAEGRRMVESCSTSLRQRTQALEEYLARLPGRRLQVVPEHERAFEVLLEAKLSVQAADEASAREKVERALGESRTVDPGVRSTGEVWVYEATEKAGAE
jgi:PadR family transcriptional regulator PadR